MDPSRLSSSSSLLLYLILCPLEAVYTLLHLPHCRCPRLKLKTDEAGVIGLKGVSERWISERRGECLSSPSQRRSAWDWRASSEAGYTLWTSDGTASGERQKIARSCVHAWMCIVLQGELIEKQRLEAATEEGDRLAGARVTGVWGRWVWGLRGVF